MEDSDKDSTHTILESLEAPGFEWIEINIAKKKGSKKIPCFQTQRKTMEERSGRMHEYSQGGSSSTLSQNGPVFRSK